MLLSVPDVAQRLSVSRQTVYRLIRVGKLPTVKIGALTRIPEDALAAYVEAHTEGVA